MVVISFPSSGLRCSICSYICVCADCRFFFVCLLVLISVLWMRVRWSGNSLGCFNNFIHVGIFFVLHYSSGVVERGGGGGHICGHWGGGCSEEASCLEL